MLVQPGPKPSLIAGKLSSTLRSVKVLSAISNTNYSLISNYMYKPLLQRYMVYNICTGELCL
ncbi:hypothetical protein GGD38_005116 [Chitinophagaceae bacterium OAS944]|nr:hypothetical protein [Chitinophagaceae bacterium OAS944]